MLLSKFAFFVITTGGKVGLKLNILSRIHINSGGENVKCILESKANYKRKCQAIQPCLKLLRVCESSHFIFFLQSNNQHEFSCTLLLGICFMGEILKSYLTQVQIFEQ